MATQDEIFRACDDLASFGQSVTLAAVRQFLGGGSYSTLSPAVQAWKARRNAKAAAPLTEPAPEAVAQKLAEVGAEIWAMARDMAQSRLDQERQALEQARQEIEAGRDEAVQLADDLSAELEAAKAQIEMLTRAIDDARAELLAAQGEAVRYREEAMVSRARLEALESVLSRLEQRIEGLAEDVIDREQGLI